jgi:transposase-like protein
MINLKDKQRIVISAFGEGKSKKQIARETGLNIKTVRRYICRHEEDLKRINEARSESDILMIADEIVEKPKYNTRGRVKRKLTNDIIEKIEEHLRENEEKRKKGMHKQQKRKIDIFEDLQAKGVDISYATISVAINKMIGKGNEAFIKAEYGLGEVCEFDWGEVKLNIEDKLKTFQMAVFTSAKGNYRYAVVFPKQDTACFIESHSLFFEHLAGTYRTMVYDNMKVAVRKFVGISEKEPTEALLKLSIYYGFKFRFCNIRAGNEKGHVERSVDYIRHKAFSHRSEFNSIEEANEYLKDICNKIVTTQAFLTL